MSDPVREFQQAMETLGVGVTIRSGDREAVVTLPCGHPAGEAVTSDEGTSYCRRCAQKQRARATRPKDAA